MWRIHLLPLKEAKQATATCQPTFLSQRGSNIPSLHPLPFVWLYLPIQAPWIYSSSYETNTEPPFPPACSSHLTRQIHRLQAHSNEFRIDCTSMNLPTSRKACNVTSQQIHLFTPDYSFIGSCRALPLTHLLLASNARPISRISQRLSPLG